MKRLILVAIVVAACSTNGAGGPGQACTLIGCNDGLSVAVNHSLQQDFTVTVKSGAQVLQTFTCRSGQQCSAFIDNATPANVTVQVATGMGTISRDYTPEYKTSRPNGPNCPPDCKQATVTLTVS